MPRKLRAPTQRYDAESELARWSMTFESGNDYFFETGFVQPAFVWPAEKRREVKREWRQACQEAWRRLGALYLERWAPAGPPPHRQRPWALDAFGEP